MSIKAVIDFFKRQQQNKNCLSLVPGLAGFCKCDELLYACSLTCLNVKKIGRFNRMIPGKGNPVEPASD
jgi:hypothetical protein